MKLYKFVNDLKKGKFKDILPEKFDELLEDPQTNLNLLYKNLLKKTLEDTSSLSEMKDFVYSCTVLSFLESKKINQIEFFFQDLKEISTKLVDYREIEILLNQRFIYQMNKLKTLDEFKSLLKVFFIMTISAGNPFESLFGLIKNFFQSFVLQILQEARSLSMVSSIIDALGEFKDLDLVDDSVHESIFLSVRFHILMLNSVELPDTIKSDLLTIKDSVLNLFPSLRSSSFILELKSLISDSQKIINKALPEYKDFTIESLIPGPALETVSNEKITQTIRKYYTTPDFKFRTIIVKTYETPSNTYFHKKFLKELETLIPLHNKKGFVKVLNNTTAPPYKIFLSASERISKNDLTIDHCHQLISAYLFLYSKKMRAKLPESDFFYLSRKGRILLSDFSFFKLDSESIFSGSLDFYGQIEEIPKVNFSFMQRSAAIILSLSAKFSDSSKSEIKNRLTDFLSS